MKLDAHRLERSGVQSRLAIQQRATSRASLTLDNQLGVELISAGLSQTTCHHTRLAEAKRARQTLQRLNVDKGKSKSMPTIRGALARAQSARSVALERARALVLAATLTPVLEEEYKRQRSMNERPVEFRYALDAIVTARAKSILDVGPGITAWPALLANCGYEIAAVDQIQSYWRGQVFLNRHWKVEKHDITTPIPSRSFDAVTCISTLEHIPNHRDAVRVMLAALNRRGILIITVPWNEARYYRNAYDLPDSGYGKGAPYITQIYSPAELTTWLEDSHAELVDQEFYKAFTGDLWTVGERIQPPVKVERSEQHQLSCLTLRRSERT